MTPARYLLQLETDLRTAIERDELWYVLPADSRFNLDETFRFESLIRWNHPQRGLVRPANSFPSAKKPA